MKTYQKNFYGSNFGLIYVLRLNFSGRGGAAERKGSSNVILELVTFTNMNLDSYRDGKLLGNTMTMLQFLCVRNNF